MTTSYPLGRLPARDPRDRQFLMATLLDIEPPPLRSVSYRAGPILDQGNTPSCVGHGWRAWLNGAPIRQLGGPSAMAIYKEAQDVDEWDGNAYEGTSVRAGARVLAAKGHIVSYFWSFDELTVRRWMLNKRGGVVIGVNWYPSMFTPITGGFLTIKGRPVGGHCVWVRGYNRPLDAYHIQNSWGPDWGVRGQAWLRSADMARLISEDGECCCGVEAYVSTRGT